MSNSTSDPVFGIMSREERQMMPGSTGKTVFETAKDAKKEMSELNVNYDNLEVVKMKAFPYTR